MTVGLLEQTYELVDAASLKLWPDNPKLHDLEGIAASIEANGFFGACLVQRSSRRVLAGNGSLQAAVGQGFGTVPVLWVDVDDDRARKIMLADNRFPELGSWDDELLAALLRGTHDLAGTGYDSTDVDAIELELQQTGMLRATGASASDGTTQRTSTQRVPNVTALIAVEDVRTVESALAQTGQVARGAALVVIAQHYLDTTTQM